MILKNTFSDDVILQDRNLKADSGDPDEEE